jgi:FtsH-binding integral membrane protein
MKEYYSPNESQMRNVIVLTICMVVTCAGILALYISHGRSPVSRVPFALFTSVVPALGAGLILRFWRMSSLLTVFIYFALFGILSLLWPLLRQIV